MQDRRAGGAEGLLACPFLALAGDRDMRIDVPDRRHRCYAEPEPAPRAIAHQQEYCLTPSFAACPTFQDWAKREAARVVGGGAPREPLEGARVSGSPVAAPDEEPVVWRGDDVRDRQAPQEPTLWGDGRTWAAPPPWLGATPDEGASSAPERAPGVARASAGSRSAPAAGDLHEPELPARAADGRAGAFRPSAPSGDDLPAFLSRRVSSGADQGSGTRARPWDLPDDDPGRPRDGAGDRFESGSGRPAVRGTIVDGGAFPERESVDRGAGMDRDAGMDRGAGMDFRRSGAAQDRGAPGRPSPDLRPDGTPRPGRAPRPEGTTSSRRAEGARDVTPAIGPDLRGGGRAPAARGARVGPDWERPLRRESYPTLHMPAGLPHLPRLWLGLVALVVAALLLFLLPTLLPGFFGAQPAATPLPTASAAPSVSVAPTPPPEPTPFVYTVAQGDTLSGIATKYGLTISEILKANPQIKNENKLGIGDRITIPVKGASSGGAAGPSPAGTAAP